MRRPRVLLLAASLLLSSCTLGVTGTGGPPDPDSVKFTFANNINGPVLWFGAGLSDVLDLRITIKGSDLRVNAPDYCKASGADILCTVPTLPAGKNFILPMKGSNLSAVATYKRASGISYSSVARP